MLTFQVIYFMKGKLPWSHIRESEMILKEKNNLSLDCLCEGLPDR